MLLEVIIFWIIFSLVVYLWHYFIEVILDLPPSTRINVSEYNVEPLSVAELGLRDAVRRLVREAAKLPLLGGGQKVGSAHHGPPDSTYEDLLATAILNKVIDKYQTISPSISTPSRSDSACSRHSTRSNSNRTSNFDEPNDLSIEELIKPHHKRSLYKDPYDRPTHINPLLDEDGEMCVQSEHNSIDEGYAGRFEKCRKRRHLHGDTGSLSSLDDYSAGSSSPKQRDDLCLTIKQSIEEINSSDMDSYDPQLESSDFYEINSSASKELDDSYSDHNQSNTFQNCDEIDVIGRRPEPWEENWLFQKKCAKTPIISTPVAMLVPNSQTEYRALIGDKDVEETSDLSDVGSDSDIEPPSEFANIKTILVKSKTVIGGKNDFGFVEEPVDESNLNVSIELTTTTSVDNASEADNAHVVTRETCNGSIFKEEIDIQIPDKKIDVEVVNDKPTFVTTIDEKSNNVNQMKMSTVETEIILENNFNFKNETLKTEKSIEKLEQESNASIKKEEMKKEVVLDRLPQYVSTIICNGNSEDINVKEQLKTINVPTSHKCVTCEIAYESPENVRIFDRNNVIETSTPKYKTYEFTFNHTETDMKTKISEDINAKLINNEINNGISQEAKDPEKNEFYMETPPKFIKCDFGFKNLETIKAFEKKIVTEIECCKNEAVESHYETPSKINIYEQKETIDVSPEKHYTTEIPNGKTEIITHSYLTETSITPNISEDKNVNIETNPISNGTNNENVSEDTVDMSETAKPTEEYEAFDVDTEPRGIKNRIKKWDTFIEKKTIQVPSVEKEKNENTNNVTKTEKLIDFDDIPTSDNELSFGPISLESNLQKDREYTEQYATVGRKHITVPIPATRTIINIPNQNNEIQIVDGPPQKGTIAEREHEKWNNAVPMLNNPYSAENIEKRLHQKQTTSVLPNITTLERRNSYKKDINLDDNTDEHIEMEKTVNINVDTTPLRQICLDQSKTKADKWELKYNSLFNDNDELQIEDKTPEECHKKMPEDDLLYVILTEKGKDDNIDQKIDRPSSKLSQSSGISLKDSFSMGIDSDKARRFGRDYYIREAKIASGTRKKTLDFEEMEGKITFTSEDNTPYSSLDSSVNVFKASPVKIVEDEVFNESSSIMETSSDSSSLEVQRVYNVNSGDIVYRAKSGEINTNRNTVIGGQNYTQMKIDLPQRSQSFHEDLSSPSKSPGSIIHKFMLGENLISETPEPQQPVKYKSSIDLNIEKSSEQEMYSSMTSIEIDSYEDVPDVVINPVEEDIGPSVSERKKQILKLLEINDKQLDHTEKNKMKPVHSLTARSLSKQFRTQNYASTPELNKITKERPAVSKEGGDLPITPLKSRREYFERLNNC